MHNELGLSEAQRQPEAAKGLPSSPGAQRSRASSAPHPLLMLQQQVGNRAVTQWVQAQLKIGAVDDPYEREANQVADQVMQGKAQPPVCKCGGACAECQAAHLKPSEVRVQTSPAQGETADTPIAPAIVQDVLDTPGQPLDSATRSWMEDRFHHNFQGVRLHIGVQAAASAEAIGAAAYTAGRHIVFGGGRYAPYTAAGRKLLAHELTHVVQQDATRAQRAIRRQPRSQSALDEKAQRIIALAQNSSQPLAERAVAVVRAIIDGYYPNDAAKVSRIVYQEDEPGLKVTYTGRGSATTGVLTVGRYFVENTTRVGLARRIAQVRHEIEHIEQVRSGMTGPSRSDEREFLAFYHEALFQELPHTGRISHSTRVSLIDGALGYYYCLSAELQRNYATRRDELLARRRTAASASGRADELPAPPTRCRRASG